MRDLQLARLQAVARARLRTGGAVPRAHERARPHAGRIRSLEDIARPAVHRQERPARHLSVRPVRQPDRGRGAAARLERHHRQADRGGLHQGATWTSGPASWCAPSPPAACTRGDIIQNAYGYGLFTGGLGAHYGAEALGATVIPISGGNTERQIMVMKDFGVTAICCTPSYFLHLIERAAELGVDVRDAAAARRRLRRRAVDRFHAPPHREPQAASAPTTSTASRKSSARAWPSSAHARTACTSSRITSIPEIIDPETGASLPEGAEGELVLTTLSKQAMPMIRYRTRDITALDPRACPCGRTLRRIRRIGRRSDDMFIIRGVNVFPSQIETALLAVEGTLPHYQIILTREKGLDEMEVQVEVTPEVFSDKIGALERLQQQPGRGASSSTLGLRAGVRLVGPQTIAAQRRQGASASIDRRNLGMKIHQLSLFLENKPGQIDRAVPRAGARRASISARCRWPTREQFGILRLIVSDWAEGRGGAARRPATWSTSRKWWRSKCPTGPAGWPTCCDAARNATSTSNTCTRFRSAAGARRC